MKTMVRVSPRNAGKVVRVAPATIAVPPRGATPVIYTRDSFYRTLKRLQREHTRSKLRLVRT